MKKEIFYGSFNSPFKESALAHKYLDNLKGVEIGAAAHNPFGLDSLNIDLNPVSEDNVYTQSQHDLIGYAAPVDIVAPGDDLPLEDESIDFVISSLVIEHFWDPIGALNEWLRVIKTGGYIFMIIPHKKRIFDKDRELTSVAELVERHQHPELNPHKDGHHNVWDTATFLELCAYLKLNVVEF